MRNIRIDATACFWWVFLLFLLPLRWIFSAVIAAFFHEFCHYLAIRAVGGEVDGILIRPAGALMETRPLEPVQELICALAGPLGGLCLLFFAGTVPLIALCALIQSSFNLLPIFPMDGGRALRSMLILLRPDRNPDRLCCLVERICLLGLLSVLLLVTFRFSLGFGVLLPLLMLLCRFFPGKRPCKTGRLALQ